MVSFGQSQLAWAPSDSMSGTAYAGFEPEVLFAAARTASDAKASAARVWPNPAIDKLNMALYTETETAALYVIYSMDGLIRKQGELKLNKGASSAALNVGSLAPGIYQLTIVQISEDQPISLLFVKQ